MFALACSACTGEIVSDAPTNAADLHAEAFAADASNALPSASADAGATSASDQAAANAQATAQPAAESPSVDKNGIGVAVSISVGSTPAVAQRPDYNHGQGFFVREGKLYDANGSEFRVRGVNKLHWDAATDGLANVKPSLTRWTVDFTRDSEANLALLQGQAGHGGTIAEGSVVMPGNWDGTCKSDVSLLSSIVDTWVAQAATWTKLEKYMILNIANEWGPAGGEQWRDAYISAIKRLRDAGYHATLSVTAPACGQDPDAIVKYGQAIFDADPEKNVIFDQHIYGEYQDAPGGAPGKFDDLTDLETHVAALAKTGLVVVLGEFGPGRDIGPSPTKIDPQRVIKFAEQYALGWLAWAWDDNNLPAGKSDDSGFGMTLSGGYQTSADLTEFGRRVVEDASWGIKALSKRASIFR